ncbi:hypothetical protein F5Y05DRAFT_416527 [Hypoxylon sp. FL0543]|nr:hypothetical protein F5Y05DRAFT_416527 [Hypoxylon sp. FL0543]
MPSVPSSDYYATLEVERSAPAQQESCWEGKGQVLIVTAGARGGEGGDGGGGDGGGGYSGGGGYGGGDGGGGGGG